jgi:hypothetical protein
MNIHRFALLLTASALSRPVAAQQAEITLPDRVYELSVVTANGSEFTDCATFHGDHSLILQAGNGLVVDWLPETGALSARDFNAVTDGSRAAANPFGLALHGTFVGDNAIRGDAINDLGLTFVFSGRLNRACAVSAIYYGDGSPYGAAPETSVLFEPERGSLAGRLYVVQLYGGEEEEDCLHFVINGTLTRNGGANQTWGMDDLNAGMGTFQAVGANASGSAGRSLRGELSALGELRVHGMESDVEGLREIAGSGRETGHCIDH